MSGLVKSNLQIGDDVTATKNFTWQVPAVPDGTVRFGRGIFGAISQDIMTVDATGLVSIPNNLAVTGNLTVSGSIDAVPAGKLMSWAGPVAPTGFLQVPIAQTNLSRTTYAALFKNITVQTTGNTNGTINITGLGITTGMAVGNPISGPGIPAGATIASIGAGSITLSVAATATANGVQLVCAPWGVGDGSTTFGMPWCPAGYSLVQANGNVGSQTVGQVISHQHDIQRNTNQASFTGGSGGSYALQANTGTVTSQTQPVGGTANFAAGINIMQVIKY